MKISKESILKEIQSLDTREESSLLSEEEIARRLFLKESFKKSLARKVRQEEIEWRQRSRCQWLNDGGKNSKFFHGLASNRLRRNRISYLMDGNMRLDYREDIIITS